MAVPFNAGDYLVDRHVREGHGDRVAVRAPGATLTYAELAHQVRRVEAGLHALGVRPEERVALVMVDGVELLSGILAAMRMGAVAMPVSTMLRAGELGKLLADSRARTVLVSDELAETVDAARDIAYEVTTVVHRADWDQFLAAGTDPPPYEAWEDSPALWLYTSGTTGEPKGAMHRHASMREVAETYAKGVLGIRPDDRCLSVAKLFFAYGLGNSATFPLSVGATTILEPARPPPAGGRLRVGTPGGLRGRGVAGAAVPAVPGPLRRAHPRRHRLDRGLAHLHVQPPGRRAARLLGRTRAGLPGPAA